MSDPFLYSIESVQIQLPTAPFHLGSYELRFYADGNRPAKEPTETIETFFYFPSGGTLRDREMNIIFYEPRLDRYRKYATRTE